MLEKDARRKERQQKYYNKGSGNVPKLEEGDSVRMQSVRLRERKLIKATVLGQAGVRPYEVEEERWWNLHPQSALRVQNDKGAGQTRQ